MRKGKEREREDMQGDEQEDEERTERKQKKRKGRKRKGKDERKAWRREKEGEIKIDHHFLSKFMRPPSQYTRLLFPHRKWGSIIFHVQLL